MCENDPERCEHLWFQAFHSIIIYLGLVKTFLKRKKALKKINVKFLDYFLFSQN